MGTSIGCRRSSGQARSRGGWCALACERVQRRRNAVRRPSEWMGSRCGGLVCMGERMTFRAMRNIAPEAGLHVHLLRCPRCGVTLEQRGEKRLLRASNARAAPRHFARRSVFLRRVLARLHEPPCASCAARVERGERRGSSCEATARKSSRAWDRLAEDLESAMLPSRRHSPTPSRWHHDVPELRAVLDAVSWRAQAHLASCARRTCADGVAHDASKTGRSSSWRRSSQPQPLVRFLPEPRCTGAAGGLRSGEKRARPAPRSTRFRGDASERCW